MPKRFRVAFSFAGEKRDFVKQTADLLAARFGEAAILYDKYHEAEFARQDLSIYLPNLYNRDADLVAVVVCPAYDAKEWTGLEWLAIHDLLQQRRREEVLLCRFDHAHVEGLFRGAGFIELDHKTPDDFVKLILERLAINENLPKDFYTTPLSLPTPTTSLPHNLPRLQPFFGREEELKKIAGALDPDDRTWGALIDGPGGMGKTSLAVRAALDASPEDFTRIVFVSLKSRELDDDGVRDLSGFLISGLAELFNELARELEHDEITRATEEERPRLLIEALRDTKTLLVLDNLESLTKSQRDVLFNFVKRLPPGCKAILTARGRIGSGAEELILEKLSSQAALETLAELATHNPQLAMSNEAQRLKLYEETGGKPLLLRWTAGQIGRGHCLTLQDALDFLRSCPENNDPLDYIFGDLVEDFSEAETKTLCALTYFTLPASAKHISEIAELSEAETNRALRLLTNRSLVVPDADYRAFALVPLVADFLRKHKPEIVAESGNRLEKLTIALIIKNGFRSHDRYPILDEAWPIIAAALPLFLAGAYSRLQIMCDALSVFLNFTGRWDEWLALETEAEARAVAAKDFSHAGWRACNIGRLHRLRGQADEVLICAERAANHWQKAPDGDRERAAVLHLCGIGHGLKRDYPAAIAAYREAIELWRSQRRESADVARVLNDLALVERLAGDFMAAECDYLEGLRIVQAVGHREGIATCIGNLAELALDRTDWHSAEALAHEALGLSQKVGRQELIALDCFVLAQTFVRQNRKEEALPHAQRAVEIYTRLRHPDLEAARRVLAECEE